VVVCSNYAAKCITVSGSNPIGGIFFLVFWSTYVRYGRKKVHVRYLSSPDEFLLNIVAGSSQMNLLKSELPVVYVGIMGMTRAVWVGQERVWVGHGRVATAYPA